MNRPVESVAQHYVCTFWDGKTQVRRHYWASSIEQLENTAYCTAHRESMQLLGYELVEVAA